MNSRPRVRSKRDLIARHELILESDRVLQEAAYSSWSLFLIRSAYSRELGQEQTDDHDGRAYA